MSANTNEKPSNPVNEKPSNPVGDQDVDVCIIGAGPAGCVAARTLARQKKKVLILEAGKRHDPSNFRNSLTGAFRDLYHDYGLKMNEGLKAFSILLGKGVGGSTLVNSNICVRPPKDAVERFANTAGWKNTTHSGLEPYVLEVERTLEVNTIRFEELGPKPQAFARGLQKLGWKGGVIARNAVNCAPCGRCFNGCPTGAKRSTDVNFASEAEKLGAVILPECTAENFRVDGKKVTEIQVSRANGEKFTVKAKHFVLAAGTIGTPRLLLRQGLCNSSGQVGKNFRCHPTSGAMGFFAEDLDGYKSIPQGYYCDHFYDEGILLEDFWAPAEGFGAIMPGFGKDLMDRMFQFKKIGTAGGMIRDITSGEIKLDDEGFVRMHYDLVEEDLRKLTRVFYLCAEVMFAAGAREVVLDSVGYGYLQNPGVLRSMDELVSLRSRCSNLGATIVLEGNHPQGTCRSHTDPRRGVVDEFGRTHDLPNLWILDASTFPEALGVNPQIAICALALRNSEVLAQEA